MEMLGISERQSQSNRERNDVGNNDCDSAHSGNRPCVFLADTIGMIQEAQLAHMISHQRRENQGQDRRENTERQYEKQDILLKRLVPATGSKRGRLLLKPLRGVDMVRIRITSPCPTISHPKPLK